MREAASLLVSEGHHAAYSYHLGRVWYEATLARERLNEAVALDAIAFHTVIAQALAGGKLLQTFLKELRGG